MKLLRGTVKVKAKNLEGKTARDILQTHQSPFFHKACSLFHSAKERLLCDTTTTLASYLSKKPSFIEKQKQRFGLTYLSKTRQGSLNSNDDSRSVILVVAILIVTATYQANLSPPGGYWQEDSKPGDKTFHLAGEMVMPFYHAIFFYIPNGVAFFSSLYVIMILTVGLPMWKVIYGSVAAIGIANFALYAYTTPVSDITSGPKYIRALIFLFAYPAIIGFMVFALFVAFYLNKRRRHQVDFPERYFSSPHELC